MSIYKGDEDHYDKIISGHDHSCFLYVWNVGNTFAADSSELYVDMKRSMV